MSDVSGNGALERLDVCINRSLSNNFILIAHRLITDNVKQEK